MNDRKMTAGRAAGIFSNIKSEQFTDHEKAEAIYIIMHAYNYGGVRRDAMMEAVTWLWNRCFRLRKEEKPNE